MTNPSAQTMLADRIDRSIYTVAMTTLAEQRMIVAALRAASAPAAVREALEPILKNLDSLDKLRAPGPWRKAHDSILDARDRSRAKAVVVARCDQPWHSGFDHDMAKASKNARFIVALENAWPKIRAALATPEEEGK
jgi:hypothetical protein